MRKDFHKVVIERPRHGSHGTGYYESSAVQARRFKLDTDGEVTDPFSGGRVSMKFARASVDIKSFSDLLGPLIGFLHSRCGRKWNDVYSEIRAVFNSGNTIHQHIYQHLWHYVDIHTYMRDGEVWYGANYGDGYPVSKAYWHTCQFYVHPVTGVLHHFGFRKSPGYLLRNKALYPLRKLNDNLGAVKKDDVWFLVDIVPYDKIDPAVHAVDTFGLDVRFARDCFKWYGVHYLCFNKRTASKKEIRKYNLNQI